MPEQGKIYQLRGTLAAVCLDSGETEHPVICTLVPGSRVLVGDEISGSALVEVVHEGRRLTVFMR